mgnify:CR=1 FL=1
MVYSICLPLFLMFTAHINIQYNSYNLRSFFFVLIERQVYI